jgi:hypothetical protein
VSFPIALGLLYWNINWPLYILLAYYGLTLLLYSNPPRLRNLKPWFRLVDDKPYCNSQKVVYDSGAKPPSPKSKNLLCVSPHGILTLGFAMLVSTEEWDLTDSKWLIADVLFYLPFVKEWMQWNDLHGCCKENMVKFMEQGENLALIPGGFQEATKYKHGVNELHIKDRKGFMKYALKYGYNVQPSYVFGETLTYWTISFKYFEKFMLWLNTWNIPTTVFFGKFPFIFMPNNDIDVTVCVGKPFKCPHVPDIDSKPELIDKYHGIYIDEIKKLFDRNKHKYLPANSSMELLIS